MIETLELLPNKKKEQNIAINIIVIQLCPEEQSKTLSITSKIHQYKENTLFYLPQRYHHISYSLNTSIIPKLFSGNMKLLRYLTPLQPFKVELRVAAKVASKALQDTKNFIQEKASTKEPLTQEDIDRFVFNNIVDQGAYPTPIGFMHFPKSVCVSVNQCVVHGIPSTRPLDFGDKINIDITAYIDGYHGDNNLTVFYGQPEDKIKLKVMEVTQKALYQAISICKPGVPVNRIGKVIEKVVNQHKMNVCQFFTGHGIGHLLHMPPMVYHKYYEQYTQIMQVGQVFTIQPIITLYPTPALHVWKDNFTAISQNNPNAQFEHTLLIVEDGCQILTKRPSENIPNPNKNIKNL